MWIVARFVVVLSLLLFPGGTIPVRAELSALGAQDNPVPLGRPILLASGNAQAYVAVAEVNRGDAAWQRLQRYSSKNGPASQGKEYLMALVVVRYLRGSEAEAALHFQAISQAGVSRDAPNIVSTRPEFHIDFTPDSMSGGWIVREVDPNDPAPLLVVSVGSDENDTQNPVYFSTTGSP